MSGLAGGFLARRLGTRGRCGSSAALTILATGWPRSRMRSGGPSRGRFRRESVGSMGKGLSLVERIGWLLGIEEIAFRPVATLSTVEIGPEFRPVARRGTVPMAAGQIEQIFPEMVRTVYIDTLAVGDMTKGPDGRSDQLHPG